MRNVIQILLFITIVFLCTCKREWGVSVRVVAFVNPEYKIEEREIEQKDSSNSINANVIVSGYVYASTNSTADNPIIGARIRIVGSDTPESSIFTDENGEFSIVLPITPDRNDENTISFVIEVQDSRAILFPLSEICKNEDASKLLHVSNPEEYSVASALYICLGWDNVIGKEIKCTFPLLIEK